MLALLLERGLAAVVHVELFVVRKSVSRTWLRASTEFKGDAHSTRRLPKIRLPFKFLRSTVPRSCKFHCG
eukprot:6103927-Amphidinium_carterae.1